MQDKGTVKQADEERKRPERVERCCRGSMARFMQVAQKSVVLAGLPARGFAECDRGLWRGLMGTGVGKGLCEQIQSSSILECIFQIILEVFLMLKELSLRSARLN